MHVMKTKNQISDPNIITDVASCTCANLRKAARVMTQRYNDALQSVNLRSTQFSILANLASHGDTPLTQLAELLVMDRTTLTRNLKPLLRRGLISSGHEEDQRVRKVSLTNEGRAVFENALPLWQQVQMEIAESLGERQWSEFMGNLKAVISAAQKG